MSATKRTKQSPKPKVMPLMPLREIIALYADRANLKNVDLAHRLGYSSPNVIAMFKAGSMKLPVNKIVPLAQALSIDPLYLALCSDMENSFNLSALLQAVSQRTAITANEEKLILELRKATLGIDVDITASPANFEKIIQAYSAACTEKLETDTEVIKRLKLKPKSALNNPVGDAKKASDETDAE